MNVLLINYEYPPAGGGAATATRAIALALQKLNARPVVLTGEFDKKGNGEEDGVHVIRVPCRRERADRSNPREMLSFLWNAALRFRGVLKREQVAACIVFFSFPCGPLGLLGRLLHGIPYVVSLRGGDVPGTEPGLDRIHRLLQPLRRRVLRKSVAVVANSPGLARLSEQADPIPVRVIPNGVDTEFFRPAEMKAASGRSTTDRFQILFAGRFTGQKNLFFLLEQLERLQSEGVDFEWIAVGDGPQRAELEADARRRGLADRIQWRGWADKAQLRDVYQSAHCFVNPSHYEGMPNTVLEAMACGLPVAASRIPGNEDVVADGETGRLFAPGDGEGLRRALRTWAQDREAARRAGLAGRRRVEREFSWKKTAEQYLALLKESQE